MRFGPRELVLLLIVLAVPLASYLLVFRPQNAKITEAKGEIEHKLDMLTRLRAETGRTADLAAANEEMAQRIDQIEARLPTNKEIDEVVRQISDLAVAAGLAPPELDSESPLSAAEYREQPLKVKTSGTFEGLYAFLLELERLPRITRLPDMKLQGVANKDDGTLDIEFTLSIYFQDGREGA
ncbi:MAG: type 4a pilus biogenesis protein PilO [Planctomycetota bacterium]